jgi:hypothetical protein
MRCRRLVTVECAALLATALFSPLRAQELPRSGVSGLDLVYATDSSGSTSQLFEVDAATATAIPVGSAIPTVPSRWAHRRRTMGALETSITLAGAVVAMTPTGDAVGNGGVHFVDLRNPAAVVDRLVATGNPASYDLALLEPLQMVFCAEDDGLGHTTLRGFSYATPGTLAPLSPPSLTLPGAPAAYVNRIGVDARSNTLHVPVVDGVQLVAVSASGTQMKLGKFVALTGVAPSTNPSEFECASGRVWIAGTVAFDLLGRPCDSGFVAWRDDGSKSWSASFGTIPNRTPTRCYAPSIGAEELAVVANGTDAYVYSLLRDPDPSSGFVRASAIGVVAFLGTADPWSSKILCPDAMGEPFSVPTVHGARVAIESSEGPPWFPYPPSGGGAELLSVLYSPLDPAAAHTPTGLLRVGGFLGGRVSVLGMDRPLWTDDGRGVVACTSQFPGAPNPGTPGIEYLDVPASGLLRTGTPPTTVVADPTMPYQSILQPSAFQPRDPTAVPFLRGFSFVGTVYHDGLASIAEARQGRFVHGQKQLQSPAFVQSSAIPGFPSILPATFDDANSSLVAIPANFGARRVSFDVIPSYGFVGLTMVAAIDDVVHVQPTGYDLIASLGAWAPLPPIAVALPTGWVTTSEIASW